MSESNKDFLSLAGEMRQITVKRKYPLFVFISSDTIRRYVSEYDAEVQKHYRRFYSMTGYSSISLTCLIAVLTVDQWHDKFGISSHVWNAMFTLGSIVFAIFGFLNAVAYVRRKELSSVDSIVDRIVNEDVYDQVTQKTEDLAKKRTFD